MRLEANVNKITKLTTEVTDETLSIINKFHERIHVPSATTASNKTTLTKIHNLQIIELNNQKKKTKTRKEKALGDGSNACTKEICKRAINELNKLKSEYHKHRRKQ